VDGLRVVRSGLKGGERIVVNGLQRVRPGSVVQPQPVEMDRPPGGGHASPRSDRPEGPAMNLSKFFIDRPILAGVLSLLIFLAGLIALRGLPISEYPEVVPPTVVVRANYPGANPKVIAETVATPLEEAINGVEGMLYMGSQATTDGLMTLSVTFKLGTDPDKAQQLVQNRVAQAEPRLPEEVRRLGVTTVKSSPDLTMVVHLVSPNNRYDMTTCATTRC
jgi:multidrug efflux pump